MLASAKAMRGLRSTRPTSVEPPAGTVRRDEFQGAFSPAPSKHIQLRLHDSAASFVWQKVS
jgi:hypothetical protein